jgi:type IV pilus biogenesis protein CpaD/CtpE
MWLSIRVLLLVLTLGLSGCARLAETRTVVWAQMGTPARVVDERELRVIIPDGQGGWLPARARLTGMVAIDEPTLEYFQGLEAERAEGGE